MKHGQELSFDGFDDEGRPVLITRAAPAYEEQHRQRVRKYLTLMSFRVPALILAAAAYGIWHNGLLSLAIIVLSIPLPWMAVLIANDRPPRRAEEPRRYDSKGRIPLFPSADRPAIYGKQPLTEPHDSAESRHEAGHEADGVHDSDRSSGDVPR